MNFRQWNHYAFVINADTDQVMFYKNGVNIGTANTSRDYSKIYNYLFLGSGSER